MKYKVGDTVLIKELDEMLIEFGDHAGGIDCFPWFNPRMEKYCGKEYKILSINNNGFYNLVINGIDDFENWSFSDDMIKCKVEDDDFKEGEMIEVRDHNSNPWERRIFFAESTSDNPYKYVCIDGGLGSYYEKEYKNMESYGLTSWKYARKIKPSCDGKEVEIEGRTYTLKLKD